MARRLRKALIHIMKLYAIRRYDGRLFPERFTTRSDAQEALYARLGTCGCSSLAWIVELLA